MMFSVIIPVYNAEKYLRPCLDSVLNQTETDWECVCVDDGSTDSSGAILDEYAKKDARFRVVHQVNQGVSAARNAALQIVEGDWITWLDADDAYSPRRLAVAREIITKESPELVRFRTRFCATIDGATIRQVSERFDYEVLQGDQAKIWGWKVLAPGGMVWTWLAKKSLLAGLTFPVGMRIKEDSIFCGMLCNRLNKVVQSEFAACCYRSFESSAIHSVRRADDCIRLLAALKDLYCSSTYLGTKLDPEVRATMMMWMRGHCEDDVKDWVWMNRGESHRARDIYRAYCEVKRAGVLDCPSPIQWWPLAAALRVWDRSGGIWALRLVGLYVRIGRMVRGMYRQGAK